MGGQKAVAFLGPEASYTHQASLAIFQPATHQFVPLTTIPAIFAAVQSGKTNYGVVPFYNTTYGAVIATLDSLATVLQPATPAPSDPTPNVSVSATGAPPPVNDGDVVFHDIGVLNDVILPISHCLLGHLPPGAPPRRDGDAPRWNHIKRVYSHEQALGQCAQFLSTHLPQADRITDTSTSRAAERIASSQTGKDSTGNRDTNGVSESTELDTTAAAISSEMAASLYNVPILERDIQDNNDNSTRFLVIEKRADGAVSHTPQTDSSEDSAPYTALIVFTVSHSAPGALARCLALLERHGLNAVGIQQRPPNKVRKEDAIFVEVQGEVDGIDKAMSEMKSLTSACRCLGCWQS